MDGVLHRLETQAAFIRIVGLFGKLSGLVGMFVRGAARGYIRSAAGAAAAAAVIGSPDIPVEPPSDIYGAEGYYENNKYMLHKQITVEQK
jgi:hypothetical protein